MSNDADCATDEEEDSSPLLPPPPPPENYQWKREQLIYTHHGLNLYVRAKVFNEIKEVLKAIGGKDALKLFKGGTVGRLVDHRRHDSANVPLHHLLTRQIIGTNIPSDEAWFYVGGRILRFTPADYAIITGLHFGYIDFDPYARHQISSKSLFQKFRSGSVKVSTLYASFKSKSPGREPIDYVKAANLLMYYKFLLCRDDVAIKKWAWTLVEDLDAWNWFPWGAYTYQTLIHYLNKVGMDDVSKVLNYHFCGPVWALQIWFYELIPSFGELCGSRDTIPRFSRCLMGETRQAQMEWKFFFDQRELEVRDALEIYPLDEIYYKSLSNGYMFCVIYKPPVKIAEKKQPEPNLAKKIGK